MMKSSLLLLAITSFAAADSATHDGSGTNAIVGSLRGTDNRRDSFKKLGNMTCRTSHGEEGAAGQEFELYGQLTLEACREKCLGMNDYSSQSYSHQCFGFEYSPGAQICEVWKAPIDSEKIHHVDGIDCYIDKGVVVE